MTHVAIGERIEPRAGSDRRGKLLRAFIAQAPGASDPAIWDDIVRIRTLNAEQVRKGAEKHVCPLQFDIVDRLINFFSMPEELVFDPFGGLSTVPVRTIKVGRRGRGVDLNPDDFDFARQFLRDAEAELATPTLFDVLAMEAASARGRLSGLARGHRLIQHRPFAYRSRR